MLAIVIIILLVAGIFCSAAKGDSGWDDTMDWDLDC